MLHSSWREDFRALAGPIAAALLKQHGYPNNPDGPPDIQTVTEYTVSVVTALHQASNVQARKELYAQLNKLRDIWLGSAREADTVGAGPVYGAYRQCVNDIERVLKLMFE